MDLMEELLLLNFRSPNPKEIKLHSINGIYQASTAKNNHNNHSRWPTTTA